MQIISTQLIKGDWKAVEAKMLEYIPADCNQHGEIDRFLRDVSEWDESVEGYNPESYPLGHLNRTFLIMWLAGIYDPAEGDEEQTPFQVEAATTRFAIETEKGFWNWETQSFHPAVEGSSTFDWLQQEDHIIECMEDICITKGAWFKVVTVVPFTNKG